MSVFPHRIRVYRPGEGAYGQDNRFVRGSSIEVHEGAANVQDRPRTLDRPGLQGDPVTMLEAVVFLESSPYTVGPIGADSGPVAGDFAEVTVNGVTRRGAVQSARALDQTLVVRWAE